MTDINVIVKLVNQYDDGKHTIATPGTLQFFESCYVNECVRRGLAAGRLSEAEMKAAKKWLDPEYEPKPKPKTLVHFF